MSRSRELRRLVSRASRGVIQTLSALVLYELAFGVALLTTGGGKSVRAMHRAEQRAGDIADQFFLSLDPSKVQGALFDLRRKGLVKTVAGKWYEAQLTKQGLDALKQDVPQYREKRPWDKRVYLVSYDIDEEDHQLRKLFHGFLVDIRCAPIQKSVFLSVYNPRGLIRSWLREHVVLGDILVSDLGPDGLLGDRPLTEIVKDAYRIDQLNQDYAEFLRVFPTSTLDNPSTRLPAWFQFQSILQRDPQLPFELLPDDWLGDRAYNRIRPLVRNSALFDDSLSSPSSFSR